MSLRIRRGTEAQRLGFTPDLGEIIWTTNGEKLYVGDGVTIGGKDIAAQLAGAGLTFNPTTGKLDSSATFTTDQITQGVNNKYFSNELAQDAVASALVAGVHTGISFVYNTTQDTANRIDATVSLSLDDLSDVYVSGVPTNGQVLKYNTATSRWEAGADVDTGIISVQSDTAPKLGGNLGLNSYNITGTGNINTTGSIYASSGLGGNLNLNNNNITGTGNISVTGTIAATLGLGGSLNLNANNITGIGNINITGTISATGTSTLRDASVYSTSNKISTGLTAYSITDGTDAYPGWTETVIAKTNWTSPTYPVASDVLGGYKISVQTSTNVLPVGVLSAELTADADLVSGVAPRSNVYIGVGNNTGVARYKFRPNGVFEAPVLKAANYITAELPGSPEKGYIAFDSTTNQFKGWNGSSWVVLG